jgi:HAD superfamily hydrolase (TIGR01509 family)
MANRSSASEVASRGAPHLPRRPAAVFLDAGNTIVHLDYDLIADMFAKHVRGEVPTPEAIRRAEWRARVRLDSFLGSTPHEAMPMPTSTESRGTLRRYLTLIRDEAGIEMPAADLALVLDEIEDYHQAHNLWSKPHPFANRVLGELKEAGCKLAVVSNAGGDVAVLLARMGLAELFSAIIDSGVVGVEKPDPAIFHLAARELGVAPEAAIHVGDLPAVDVKGARAAGVEPVLLDPLGLWVAVECVKVRDLTALPDLVRRAPA